MFTIYPANSRFSANHGWLQSNFSFSFAEYYDPENMQFGPLRVLNDDVVAPKKGFGMHPHAEMEIVTVVLKGYLQHKDSQGHTATTTFGGIQRMSAGTGIYHSEMNPSDDEEVSLLQMWFLPDEKGLTPSYEQTSFDISQMKNQLLPVVKKNPESDGIAHIHQDLTIYLSELEADQQIDFIQSIDRRTFLFILEGEVKVNGEHVLKTRDSARVTELEGLKIEAIGNSTFMLIDLP